MRDGFDCVGAIVVVAVVGGGYADRVADGGVVAGADDAAAEGGAAHVADASPW